MVWKGFRTKKKGNVKIMGLPKFYYDRITLIYDNFEYKEYTFDKFEVKINEENDTKRLYIRTSAEYLDDYHFGNIDLIVIDTLAHAEIKVRKIAKVEFLMYHEVSEPKGESFINLEFKVVEFEIQQSDLILPIVSLIRDLKINRIDE